MNTLTIDHKNGNSTTYQLINSNKDMPIAYHVETSKKVIDALEYCRKNKIRIKLNLGDISTGKSWNEEHDTIGYIGLSKGHSAYYPILVYNNRSYGGGLILDNCIIQIKESKGKVIFYQSENFNPPIIEIKEGSSLPEYSHELFINAKFIQDIKPLKVQCY